MDGFVHGHERQVDRERGGGDDPVEGIGNLIAGDRGHRVEDRQIERYQRDRIASDGRAGIIE